MPTLQGFVLDRHNDCVCPNLQADHPDPQISWQEAVLDGDYAADCSPQNIHAAFSQTVTFKRHPWLRWGWGNPGVAALVLGFANDLNPALAKRGAAGFQSDFELALSGYEWLVHPLDSDYTVRFALYGLIIAARPWHHSDPPHYHVDMSFDERLLFNVARHHGAVPSALAGFVARYQDTVLPEGLDPPFMGGEHHRLPRATLTE